MSGTKAHEKREYDKRQAEHNKLVALNNNRTSLLQITIEELISLYGEDKVNYSHPLFSAIQSSTSGSIVNLEQLKINIISFNDQEEIDV